MNFGHMLQFLPSGKTMHPKIAKATTLFSPKRLPLSIG